MNAAILLVTDFLFHTNTVVVTVILTASLYAWLWFAIGLLRRARIDRGRR